MCEDTAPGMIEVELSSSMSSVIMEALNKVVLWRKTTQTSSFAVAKIPDFQF